jgi:hypothetical protein
MSGEVKSVTNSQQGNKELPNNAYNSEAKRQGALSHEYAGDKELAIEGLSLMSKGLKQRYCERDGLVPEIHEWKTCDYLMFTARGNSSRRRNLLAYLLLSGPFTRETSQAISKGNVLSLAKFERESRLRNDFWLTQFDLLDRFKTCRNDP